MLHKINVLSFFRIIENFIEQKNSIFEQLKEVLNNEDDEDDVANETSVSIQLLNENFKDLCHKTWTVLMSKELNLFERTEVLDFFSFSPQFLI